MMTQINRAGNSSGERAWGHVRDLQALDRWSSFDRYTESSAWCARALREAGVGHVEPRAFPVDGRAAREDWVMPLAWDVTAATLDVLSPSPRRLADYRAAPQSLVMWSAPTSPEGMEAELVVLDEAAPEEGWDIRRRIVFTPRHPKEIKAAVASGGGIGIISDWMKACDLPDERQWINTWSDAPGGWAMHARDSRLWGFTLTPREGARLREEARRGTVRLRATVDTRLYEGELQTVDGVVPGTSDEEVLLMAHINEQGANDNGAGAAAILEVARRLAQEWAETPPRRSVRFLLMPECYGTIAWVASNRQTLRRTAVALNVDSGAGAYESEDSVLEIYANPLCSSNYADAVLLETARAYYDKLGRPDKWRLRRYSLAGDNFLCDPLIGVPHPWIAMGDGGDFWHNSADIPERVDPRSLEDLVAVITNFTRFMATADWTSIAAAARLARDRLPESQRSILRFPDDPPLLSMPLPGPVPCRTTVGALTLDPVPPRRWGPFSSSPRWWGPQLAAWWWADGTHTLPEIEALIEKEFGRPAVDLRGMFEWLESAGYVRLEKAL